MVKVCDLLKREKQVYAKQMNLKYTSLEKQYQEVIDKLHNLEKEYDKLDKEHKLTIMERDKMRERLVRMKERKFKHHVRHFALFIFTFLLRS